MYQNQLDCDCTKLFMEIKSLNKKTPTQKLRKCFIFNVGLQGFEPWAR